MLLLLLYQLTKVLQLEVGGPEGSKTSTFFTFFGFIYTTESKVPKISPNQICVVCYWGPNENDVLEKTDAQDPDAAQLEARSMDAMFSEAFLGKSRDHKKVR